MEQWIQAILVGEGLPDAFPVRATPSFANADLLRRRVDFIRDELIPQLGD
jgi:hypothetical protein